MATDPNLQFVREKINRLRSAVMYSMGNGLVKLPNDIVTLVKMDDEGHLWFLSRRPGYLPTECEQSFPARLCFYRKGYDFHVEVSGKAIIVNNAYSGEQGNQTEEGATEQKPLLLKMTMTNIEYTEPHGTTPPSWIESIMTNLYKWVIRHVAVQHRHTKPVLSKLHKTPWHG